MQMLGGLADIVQVADWSKLKLFVELSELADELASCIRTLVCGNCFSRRSCRFTTKK